MARVTAAVLNWNGREMLHRILASLERQSFTALETVVLDNGSTDGSPEHVRARWPEVRVVALPDNVGVTAALNHCVRGATTEFVALLNNDVELAPDWVAELVAAMDAEPGAASASGKTLSLQQPELFDRPGDEMAWSGLARARGAGERDVGQYDTPERIFGPCGGVSFYRRSVFDAIGAFDELFFMQHEDTDWNFRAQLAGYVSLYVPAAVAYHAGSATIDPASEFSLHHGIRNAAWTIAKNFPSTSLVRHAPELLHRHLLLIYYTARGRRLGILLRAWCAAVKGLRPILEKRREVQALRTVEPRELDAVIMPGRAFR